MSNNNQRPPRPPGDPQRPTRPPAPGDPQRQPRPAGPGEPQRQPVPGGPRGPAPGPGQPPVRPQAPGQTSVIRPRAPGPAGPPRQPGPPGSSGTPRQPGPPAMQRSPSDLARQGMPQRSPSDLTRPQMPQRSPSDLTRPQMPQRSPSDLSRQQMTTQRPSGPPAVRSPAPSQSHPGAPSGPPTGTTVGRAGPMGPTGRAGPPTSAAPVTGRAGPLGRAAPPTGAVPAKPPGVRSEVDQSMIAENLRAVALAKASGSGSGSGSGEATKGSGSGGSGGALPIENPAGRASSLGRRRLLVTRPSGLHSKKGGTGTPVALTTNYFNLMKVPSWKLYQHSVDFQPEEDVKQTRKFLFRQLEHILGKSIFDGAMLFATRPFATPETPAVHDVKNKEGKFVKIRIRFVGEVEQDSMQFTQVLNIIMRQCLAALELKEIQRNYFNPQAKVVLEAEGLEIWPGYATSLRQHEASPLLCCEISNKIMRTESVLDMMNKCARQGPSGAQETIKKMLIGQIVLTRYNYQTMRVDDVDFGNNPRSGFDNPKVPGGRQSLMDYYESKYKVRIRDPAQPLLVSNATGRDKRRGMDTVKWLIPELCSLTGLTDAQRADYRLMTSVQAHTRTAPPQRMAKLLDFINRMNSNAKVKQELANWDVSLDNGLVQLQGRLFNPEEIVTGGNQIVRYQSVNAEWQNVFRNKLSSSYPCQKWAVIYPKKDTDITNKFLGELCKAANGMGFPLGNPKHVQIPDTRPQTYIGELKQLLGMGPQMVMVVVPNNKGDIYHTVKKVTYVESPVPCQVMTLTVLNKAKSLAPIATKVAAQMAAKLGAELWTVKIPLKSLMVVGYDTWHDTSKKDTSVGAIVCTLNQALCRYLSFATLHKNGEELCAQFKTHLMTAIDAYKACNGHYPAKIIIYRDGVGDGQIEQLLSVEVEPLKVALTERIPGLQFTYVIVSKRINTKFFQGGYAGAPPATNPLSGTVVDDIVTLPERYDFFLVSQSVRQGTVNPTSYNVVEDNSTLKPEHLQQLTYKMTHLYYNWPGVVRVPAVCQYAHKLAYLVGQSLHTSPHPVMGNQLFYL